MSSRISAVGSVFTLFSFLLSLQSFAATLAVKNTNDAGNGSLRQAVLNAANGDSIVFQLSLPAKIALASPIAINKSLNIRGSGLSLTISGEGRNQLFNVASGTSFSISTLTLANGLATAGGAIYNQGSLSVSSVRWVNNEARGAADNSGWGGAIFNERGASAQIQACVFEANSASLSGLFGEGGSIYNVGNMVITDSSFAGNSAKNGGAIANFEGTLSVKGATIMNNAAENEGGGLFNFGGVLLVSNTTFDSNTAIFEGAGLYNFGSNTSGTATILNSFFRDNFSDRSGGGISNYQGLLIVKGSRLVGNTASSANGGGVFNYQGTVQISKSQLEDNTAGQDGGGLYSGATSDLPSSVKVQDSFIDLNNAGAIGGGIFNSQYSALNLKNTAVINNLAPIDADIHDEN